MHDNEVETIVNSEISHENSNNNDVVNSMAKKLAGSASTNSQNK